MKNFKTILVRSSFGFSLVVLFTAVLPLTAQAAAGKFNVDFQTMPLFAQTNIAPGDSVTRTIAVANEDTNSESFYTEALNSNNTGLANALTLTIKNGSTQLYSGTLANFFTAGQVPLDSVAVGATTTYIATVSFVDSSNNTYQNVSAGFDLCIGIVGGDTTCDGSNSGGGGGGSGSNSGGGNGGSFTPSSGGGSIATLLHVFNEIGTMVPPTTGAITWNSNLPATTQVVYGLKSDGPYTLDLYSPSFGYPNATSEDATLTTNHSVHLPGLTPGAIYYFRVVSRLHSGAVPTVSPEYQLAVPGPLAFVPFSNISSRTPGSTGENNQNRINNLLIKDTPGGTASETNGSRITDTGNNNAFAAAASLAGPFSLFTNGWFWFFIVFSAISMLIEELYERVRHRQEYVSTSRRANRRIGNYAIASVVGLIISLIYKYSYMYDVIPFAMFGVLFVLWFLWRRYHHQIN